MTHHNVLVLLGVAGVAATFTGFTGVVYAEPRRGSIDDGLPDEAIAAAPRQPQARRDA